ncbi:MULTISPECIES: hypothetical protein [unclassified Phaeobacter]|uniref:hypothetical protein n=1 Tax=unclassified Phaeobacter TaxID=2621772 RepID=UPI003A88FD86
MRLWNMPNPADRDDAIRQKMINECEARRRALQLSARGFSVKAGLEPSYYGHWIAKQFQFPSVKKMKQITDAFERLEAVQALERRLKSEADR